MESPKTEEERRERERLKELARQGKIKPGPGKIREEFWEMPRPEDPEGLLLKALLEDRRQGR